MSNFTFLVENSSLVQQYPWLSLLYKDAVVTENATIIITNYGVVSNCYSLSDISHSSGLSLTEAKSVGGLVSLNKGVIQNCFYGGI